MKTGRFFVTSVIFFAMAGVAACKEPSHRPQEGGSNEAVAQREAEAKELLEQAKSLQLGLMTKYKLFIASEAKIQRNTVIHTRDFVANFNWRSVRLDGRREIQAKLNLFVELVERLLAIDEKTDREQLMTWLESARMYQQSLANFEKIYGLNYDPNEDGQAKPGPRGGKSPRDGVDI